MNETKIKQDIYQNINDKQVLNQAQKFGIAHILQAKECVIPFKTEDNIYIFLSFKKKGDSGYMYVRIYNPQKNFHQAAILMTEYMRKMNCTNAETHTPVKNIN